MTPDTAPGAPAGPPPMLGASARIAWDDSVLPFQLDRSDIRGRVARMGDTISRVLGQHDYPAPVEALVAEATLLTALIGQTVPAGWTVSLQVRGDGPARMIATDYFAPPAEGEPARLRAWAGHDDGIPEDAAPFDLIGKGYFALMIDQGEGTTPYRGITPIAGGSLSACAETYFAQSEQLPTRFATSFGRLQERGARESWRAGGVMLQHMPKASPLRAGAEGGSGEGGLMAAADVLGSEEGEDWARANMLLDTVEPIELVDPALPPTDLLVRLFHEEAPRVWDAQPVRFGCTCGEGPVRRSLSIYPPEEIAEMVTEDGVVTADCQFCGAHYELDPATLGEGAEEDGGEGPAHPAPHG